jgi:hypothetical protein
MHYSSELRLSSAALPLTYAKWERGHMGPTRWGVEASGSLPHRLPKLWPAQLAPLRGGYHGCNSSFTIAVSSSSSSSPSPLWSHPYLLELLHSRRHSPPRVPPWLPWPPPLASPSSKWSIELFHCCDLVPASPSSSMVAAARLPEFHVIHRTTPALPPHAMGGGERITLIWGTPTPQRIL